jgi:hypothetical protein
MSNPQFHHMLSEEQVDECAFNECQKPIYRGQSVEKCGPDLYCDEKCLIKGLGAVVIKSN